MTDEQELRYASPEDIEFFNKCIKGLPDKNGIDGTGFDKFGLEIPFSCSAHSVRCFREIVKIVKPKRIFEIGTNCCHSASMWLELAPEASMLTCDISYKDETVLAAQIMKERYGDRFKYFNRTEGGFEQLLDYEPDLAFIDGAHELDDVRTDIEACLIADIKFIAFDDIMEVYGPGVMPAIKNYPKLKLMKELGNIALYLNANI